MAISKFERGEATPTSKSLIQLARAFNTPIEFFFRPDTVTLGELEYRKRSSLGKKQLERIKADVLDNVERFIELLSLFPKPPVTAFENPVNLAGPIASLDQVEQVALEVRDAWQLGRDAIPNLADLLEERGIFVLVTDADGYSKFDGLAARVNGFPLIVVGAGWPGDRQRFTLAHELGHLVLGEHLTDGIDNEVACNRFAGAFLAPKGAVINELGNRRNHIEWRELYQLKHEFGLSMLAWVYRARDVGVITQNTAEILIRMFSSKGWRKKEPGDPFPSECPHLFEQLVMHAFAEEMISMSKAAELMSLSLGEFRARLTIESHHVAVNQ
jgi:Zn-dependent peptidase ImmA (M78 family)